VAQSDEANTGETRRVDVSSGIHPLREVDSDEAALAEAPLPAGCLAPELEDADRLLRYAAEVGIEVDHQTRDAILNARAGNGAPMSQALAAGLLTALTKLSARVSPVTAQSLRACEDPAQPRKVLRAYTRIALLLAILSVSFSAVSFVSSTISDSIRKDVDTANGLALNLSEEARRVAAAAPSGAAPSAADTSPSGVSASDMLKELQQFAIAIRSINEHGRQLRWFSIGFAAPMRQVQLDGDRKALELKVPLDTLADERTEALSKIKLYQDVRYNAVSAQEGASLVNAGVATCILPVLYAVLGACAYLLRLFEEQIRKRTFIADTHAARFFIAAIGGLVVGLFNNFNVAEGGSLSPLGLAFLVGYAVDVFFSFLEGLLQAFGRQRTASQPAASADSKG
jgi:hypothetical protein